MFAKYPICLPIGLGVVSFSVFVWGAHMCVRWVSFSRDLKGIDHIGLEQWTRKEYYWALSSALGFLGLAFSLVLLIIGSKKKDEARCHGFPLD